MRPMNSPQFRRGANVRQVLRDGPLVRRRTGPQRGWRQAGRDGLDLRVAVSQVPEDLLDLHQVVPRLSNGHPATALKVDAMRPAEHPPLLRPLAAIQPALARRDRRDDRRAARNPPVAGRFADLGQPSATRPACASMAVRGGWRARRGGHAIDDPHHRKVGRTTFAPPQCPGAGRRSRHHFRADRGVLDRWTPDMLAIEVRREYGGRVQVQPPRLDPAAHAQPRGGPGLGGA